MSLKNRFLNAIRSATTRGLQRASVILLVGYGVLLTGDVYIDFTYKLTSTKLTTTFERIADEDVPSLAGDMLVEKEMIAGFQDAKTPVPEDWESLFEGYPVLYAWPMAHLHDAAGDRGLALFNVVCTLLTMWIVRSIAIRSRLITSSAKKIVALSEGKLKAVVKAANAASDAPSDSEGDAKPKLLDVKSALLGLIAMSIFSLNPIVFQEATRPSPRPFAYLLTAIAISLSLRALLREGMPGIRCGILTMAGGLVHLPALLVAFPVLLTAWAARVMQSVEKQTPLGRLSRNSRRIVVALVLAVLAAVVGRAVSHIPSIEGPVSDWMTANVPKGIRDWLENLLHHLEQFEAQVGSFLVNYAPQLAALSLVPLPSMKSVVERTMLIYGVGLLAFFSWFYPEGRLEQLYPVLIPTAILGAIGIVNTIDLYREDAVLQLARLWARFFAVLATMPVVGTTMVWVSHIPVDRIQLFTRHELGLHGLITPYSLLITVIAVIGFARQRYRIRHLPQQPEPAEPDEASGDQQPDSTGKK